MTLDKIRNLIARAAHPGTPVEEARTSAVIACRMIVEHGVHLDLSPNLSPWLDLLRSVFDAVTAPPEDGRSAFLRYARNPAPANRRPVKGGTKKRQKRRAKKRKP